MMSGAQLRCAPLRLSRTFEQDGQAAMALSGGIRRWDLVEQTAAARRFPTGADFIIARTVATVDGAGAANAACEGRDP